MENLYARLDQTLYRTPEDHLPAPRLELCLSLHACLTARVHVPRIYLPDSASGRSPESFGTLLQTILLSDLARVKDETQKHLDWMGLWGVQDWDLDKREEALHWVKDVLEKEWGDGAVHYAMGRWTPFTNEDAAEIIAVVVMEGTGRFERMLGAVKQRLMAKVEYQRRYAPLYAWDRPPWDLPTFHLVCREKIDAIWQSEWGSPAAYTRQHAVDRIRIAEELF